MASGSVFTSVSLVRVRISAGPTAGLGLGLGLGPSGSPTAFTAASLLHCSKMLKVSPHGCLLPLWQEDGGGAFSYSPPNLTLHPFVIHGGRAGGCTR